MESELLVQLIDARFELLSRLITLSRQQRQAIEENQMTELMRVLSDKQKLIEMLAKVSRQLSPASKDDPQQRRWSSEEARQQCRERQEACEQMHVELLAMEAECESGLTSRRGDIEDQLMRLSGADQATKSYSQAGVANGHSVSGAKGARLDLSSD